MIAAKLRVLAAFALITALVALASSSCGGGDDTDAAYEDRTPIARPTGSAALVYTTAVAVEGGGAVSRLHEWRPGEASRQFAEYPNKLIFLMLASPDGRYLGMSQGGIMTIRDRLGAEVATLGIAATSNSGAGPFASWSADSKLYAYSRITIAEQIPALTPQLELQDEPSDRGWIEIVDVENRQVITPGWLREEKLFQPSFSPYGSEFVAIDYFSGGITNRSVAIADLEKRLRFLTSEPPGNKGMPLWSPDGKWVAYWMLGAEIRPEKGKEYGTFVVPAGGGEDPRLLSLSNYPVPQAWSADGKYLALACIDPDQPASYQTTRICRVDVESGEIERFGVGFSATLSPDGETIAYLSDPDSQKGTFTLKTVRVTDAVEETISTDVPYGGMTWALDPRSE